MRRIGLREEIVLIDQTVTGFDGHRQGSVPRQIRLDDAFDRRGADRDLLKPHVIVLVVVVPLLARAAFLELVQDGHARPVAVDGALVAKRADLHRLGIPNVVLVRARPGRIPLCKLSPDGGPHFFLLPCPTPPRP